ncbi:hypothetical protein SAMN05421640_0664 [Ekhidna lutea]|uniref:UDP-4-amino-4,6-dideoxy-N-acetyl-beta-L-altrosamine transaminase n=1 Tax=Ekhidna lutea TaxID=447679 RepID=A0A239FH43_EKHLU|nr:UDP-4-amino-4,6-dideoxy-N-acetyl-beta-L-altrosamine transaminase [Ekhidna lutea]SNS56075.1 hypothetical protein SAMN05421640_0664 [Ekhidna lutea]
MSKVIPYGKQDINQEDIDAVVKALKSDYLTQGPRIKEFEEAFAEYVGSNYAVAVSNGTAALHLCVLALGLNEGKKVITTPITFAASANCIRYCGGDVVFVDIDPKTYLIDLEEVEKLLSKHQKGTFSGIIPVDFAGRPVDLNKFRNLAEEYNLWIIEDACHAPGGYFVDSKKQISKCGNGQFADLSIFSFHPVKHIASGEGGMITTNDEKLYNKLLTLRTHGISRTEGNYKNSVEFATGESGLLDYPGWYMEMQELGFNYRLTDIQAALGKSQLSRANEGLKRRREIAAKYFSVFSGKDFIRGQSGIVEGHAYHLYVIEVDNRLGLYNHLREQSILAQIHYIPCHLMPYYREFGWKEGDLPHSENYYRHCISLPMYPGLSDNEVEYVIEQVLKFFE